VIGSVWTKLGTLQPGQAVVLTGLVGFITLAAGHFLNAWLARRRDRALDNQQRQRVQQAFIAEITVLVAQLEWVRNVIWARPKNEAGLISLPLCRAYTPFRSELIKNLSLLRRDQIQKVANIYAKLDQFDARNEGYGIKDDENEYKLPFRNLNSSIEVHLSDYGIQAVGERVARLLMDIETSIDGFENSH